MHMLPICGGTRYYTTDKYVCLIGKEGQDRMRDLKIGDKQKRQRTFKTSRAEPRAMNPINGVMCELMLFMLRVGVWIIEIRACAKYGGTANCKWPVI